jgi:phage FluMu protein Com
MFNSTSLLWRCSLCGRILAEIQKGEKETSLIGKIGKVCPKCKELNIIDLGYN